MCFQPQRTSGDGWIDADLFPKSRFITTMMKFTVMPATQRDRELITDFAAECGALRRAQVMGIRGAPPTNKAWLLGNRFDMLPIANSTRRWEGQDAFVNNSGCAALFGSHQTRGSALYRRSINRIDCEVCQPRPEGCLDALGVGYRQSVFVAKNPMSPTGGFIGRAKILQLVNKLVS
jgi:hypothetical protein